MSLKHYKKTLQKRYTKIEILNNLISIKNLSKPKTNNISSEIFWFRNNN